MVPSAVNGLFVTVNILGKLKPTLEILPMLARSAAVTLPLTVALPVTAIPFKNVFNPLKLCAMARLKDR